MSGRRLVVIQPDGTLTNVEYSGREPGLALLQEAVGGYIEHVRVMFEERQCSAFVHDEGRLIGLRVNLTASLLAAPFGYGVICGPIAIVVRS